MVEASCDDILRGRLRLWQPVEGPRVSIDTVLLSAWTRVCKGERVLEMGTAHGAVALLLALRFPEAGSIEGLEIQEDLYDLAQKNLETNALDGRVRFIRGDLRDHRRLFPPQSFDVLVVNPPYDSPTQARGSRSARAATARQGTHCSLEDVAKAARFLLRNRGRFYSVIRANRVSEMMEVLSMNSLEPKRWRSVHHRIDREASVVLLQATRAAAKGMRVESPLVVFGPDGAYTSEALQAYDTESGTCL